MIGAARRLGNIFALTLARTGYSIVLHYRGSADEAAKTVKEIPMGVECLPIRADLTQPGQIEFLYSIVDEFNAPLTVLVNSAARVVITYPCHCEAA